MLALSARHLVDLQVPHSQLKSRRGFLMRMKSSIEAEFITARPICNLTAADMEDHVHLKPY